MKSGSTTAPEHSRSAPATSTDTRSRCFSLDRADLAGHFNVDSHMDLIAHRFTASGDELLLYAGNGDGTFAAASVIATNLGIIIRDFAKGDFDQDGDLDLAATGGNSATVVLGNGDGSFQPAVSYDTGIGSTMIEAADFDIDGFIDLAVSHNANVFTSNGLSVLPGKGDGSFGPAARFASGSHLPRTWKQPISMPIIRLI